MTRLARLSVCVIICCTAGWSWAGESCAPSCTSGACDSSGCGRGCGQCDGEYCCPTAELVKDKKTCFNVECKNICIPAVKFPWDKSCELTCGKVRTVHVLKKSSYPVEKVVYKWEADQPCGCCGGCVHSRQRAYNSCTSGGPGCTDGGPSCTSGGPSCTTGGPSCTDGGMSCTNGGPADYSPEPSATPERPIAPAPPPPSTASRIMNLIQSPLRR